MYYICVYVWTTIYQWPAPTDFEGTPSHYKPFGKTPFNDFTINAFIHESYIGRFRSMLIEGFQAGRNFDGENLFARNINEWKQTLPSMPVWPDGWEKIHPRPCKDRTVWQKFCRAGWSSRSAKLASPSAISANAFVYATCTYVLYSYLYHRLRYLLIHLLLPTCTYVCIFCR
jgi:hypothetical protein